MLLNKMGHAGLQKRPEDNIWIETKSGDSDRCYYYHSRTRETSWTKPDNAVILTQEQFNASIRHHAPIHGQGMSFFPFVVSFSCLHDDIRSAADVATKSPFRS